MSHPLPHSDDLDSSVLKPRPRRPFELTSPTNSAPDTPTSDAQSLSEKNLEPLNTALNNHLRSSNIVSPMAADGSATPSRTRSFLNLTASTLFGIYQPADLGTETENPTPWGTGAETPADSRNGSFDFARVNLPDTVFLKGADGKLRRKSTAPQLSRYQKPRRGFKGFFLPLAARVTALFGIGMLYGLLISHLHDRQKIAPVPMDLDRTRWSYLLSWGCIGALLGEALPWADVLWQPEDNAVEDDEQQRKNGRAMDAWMDVVRSMGAFIGIAFAIRKLPWQSTLQLSLTLALANPAVWYLIDRSPPGFIVSTIVALSGTAVLLGTNPALVPSPSPWQLLQGHAAKNGGLNDTLKGVAESEEFVFGIFSQESVGVATWIASVLFVSSVCFGNIGRRLAPQRA
ncbi:insig domain-containing [Lecanosticta acicola]|uniref:Insig domain-containing n=1 Tax=Lecanosticta acicola TaxID=111012 RepID=A0AAI8YTF8_9PEZI|nr:insig domain-containing [Lecanosticta acicola]